MPSEALEISEMSETSDRGTWQTTSAARADRWIAAGSTACATGAVFVADSNGASGRCPGIVECAPRLDADAGETLHFFFDLFFAPIRFTVVSAGFPHGRRNRGRVSAFDTLDHKWQPLGLRCPKRKRTLNSLDHWLGGLRIAYMHVHEGVSRLHPVAQSHS